MKTILLSLSITILTMASLAAQLRLNVEGNARVTGDVLELVKPSNQAHVLNLSSSGAAMDINATTDLYINSGRNINLDANNPSGRVGVGTSNPQVKFHVTGDRLRLSTPGNDSRYIDLRTDGSVLDISPVGADLLIDPGNYNLILATQSGRVGIGTGSPEAKLSVEGDGRIEGRLELLKAVGDSSLFLGIEAGLQDDGGNNNTFVGTRAGSSNITGFSNTFLGRNAGAVNTTGFYNTFIGAWAGTANTGGTANTFIGREAGLSNTTGTSNTFVGRNAGAATTTGSENTFMGREAGAANNGTFNTFMGHQAGLVNTTGEGNTLLGRRSGVSNTIGFYNTMVGANTGDANTEGSYNAFIGNYAGFFNTLGASNTFVGLAAGYSNTTGKDNTFIGRNAGYANTTGSSNTFVGRNAGFKSKDRTNLVAIGDSSLFNNGTGLLAPAFSTGNTAVGSKTLFSNTTGYHNTANGYNALYSNTTAPLNTAIGYSALYFNSLGVGNTANGHRALFANTEGSYNMAGGTSALYNNTEGSYNVASGNSALQNNTTGSSNTANGSGALQANTSGSFNTANGYLANVSAGNLQYASAIGARAITNANEKTVIGRNEAGVVIGGYAAWSNLSDGRFKEDIKEDVPGLRFIRLLRPVTYWVNLDKLQRHLTAQMPDSIAAQYLPGKDALSKAKRDIRTGFVAQEVETAASSINYQFDGVNAPKNANDNYSIAYSQFVPSLVKATQEQQEVIEIQEAKIGRLEQQVQELKTMVDRLLNQEEAPPADNTYVLPLVQEAMLAQNQPNPFSQNTQITYSIPAGVQEAFLQVTSVSGQVLARVDIRETGRGEVIIKAGAYPAGTYFYSLVLDGRIADTKSMVLVK